MFSVPFYLAVLISVLQLPLWANAATVPAPKISVSPTSITFSSVTVDGSSLKTVTITNKGTAALDVGDITITGTNSSQFNETNTCSDPLPSGGTCTVSVTFSPIEPNGTRTATLNIPSNDPKRKTPVTVKLTGKTSTSFTTADLAGTWTGSLLDTGAGNYAWRRMTFTIAADGSYTSIWVDSNGSSKSPAGTFSISSTGAITDKTNDPNLLCSMDAGKTVFSCTDTRNSGNTELGVFSKNGESYELSDLEGTWNGNFVAAGSGLNWWTRTTFTVIDDGTYNGSFTDSNSSSGSISGQFDINSNGVITDTANHPNMVCTMDSGKTIVSCTDTPDAGEIQIAVFTKEGPAFSLADIAGTWTGNCIATGPGAPWWRRDNVVVKSDGSFTNKKTFSNGTKATATGTLEITPDGVIKIAAENNTLCQLDADKTIFACTKTWPSDGSTELKIFTRELK
jgi:hypothetical protein